MNESYGRHVDIKYQLPAVNQSKARLSRNTILWIANIELW